MQCGLFDQMSAQGRRTDHYSGDVGSHYPVVCAGPIGQHNGDVYIDISPLRVWKISSNWRDQVILNKTVKTPHEITGCGAEVRYTAERSGDVKHSLADISRAKECLGYEPLVDFREGIERTVAWYKTVAETTNTHTGSLR